MELFVWKKDLHLISVLLKKFIQGNQKNIIEIERKKGLFICISNKVFGKNSKYLSFGKEDLPSYLIFQYIII